MVDGATATPKYPELEMPARAEAETPEVTLSLPDIVRALVGPVVVSEVRVSTDPGAGHSRPGVEVIARIVKAAVADFVIVDAALAAVIDIFHEGAEEVGRNGRAGDG